jgi:hypothetical protein
MYFTKSATAIGTYAVQIMSWLELKQRRWQKQMSVTDALQQWTLSC